MALSLVKEQRLTDAHLTDLYTDKIELWRGMAKHAFDYAAEYVEASGAQIRPDDVVPVLQPVLEVTPELRRFLERAKLRQQYWYEWFAELIVDRLWPELTGGGDGRKQGGKGVRR